MQNCNNVQSQYEIMVRVLDYRQCSYSSCNLAFYIMLLYSVYCFAKAY